MNCPPRVGFQDFLGVLSNEGIDLSIGQSVDTSVIHARVPEFRELPVLTSVGCAIRRPKSLPPKFDEKLRSRIGASGNLIVDSGGFVLMMNPDADWNVANVANLYERLNADHLVALDVPCSPEDDEQIRAEKYLRTKENTEFLYDRFGELIVPVLLGATRAELEANARRMRGIVGDAPRLVGLGGLVPVIQRCGKSKYPSESSPQRRIGLAVEVARQHFSNSRIHIFGVGSIHTVLGCVALGASSIDSIGWRQAAGFGSVYVPSRHRRLLTGRERKSPCRPFVDQQDLELLSKCGCPVCSNASSDSELVSRLSSNFAPRAIHNIWVLYQELSTYARLRTTSNGDSFLKARLSDAWIDAIEHSRSVVAITGGDGGRAA